MMKIIQKVETIIYGYDPSEFLPIWVDGQWTNRREFIAYKAKQAFLAFSDAVDNLRAMLD